MHAHTDARTDARKVVLATQSSVGHLAQLHLREEIRRLERNVPAMSINAAVHVHVCVCVRMCECMPICARVHACVRASVRAFVRACRPAFPRTSDGFVRARLGAQTRGLGSYGGA